LTSSKLVNFCIHAFNSVQIYFFSKKQIPVIYTRITKAKSIYIVYTRYIPCLNFLGFPDEVIDKICKAICSKAICDAKQYANNYA
jgi:hypothetical protein